MSNNIVPWWYMVQILRGLWEGNSRTFNQCHTHSCGRILINSRTGRPQVQGALAGGASLPGEEFFMKPISLKSSTTIFWKVLNFSQMDYMCCLGDVKIQGLLLCDRTEQICSII